MKNMSRPIGYISQIVSVSCKQEYNSVMLKKNSAYNSVNL